MSEDLFYEWEVSRRTSDGFWEVLDEGIERARDWPDRDGVSGTDQLAEDLIKRYPQASTVNVWPPPAGTESRHAGRAGDPATYERAAHGGVVQLSPARRTGRPAKR